jgi:hypothetical protein
MKDRCFIRMVMSKLSAATRRDKAIPTIAERVNVLIQECTVYLPINALRGGRRLVDTAGLGEGRDHIMKNATAQSIRTAATCVVVLERSLAQTEEVANKLFENGFFHKMLRCVNLSSCAWLHVCTLCAYTHSHRHTYTHTHTHTHTHKYTQTHTHTHTHTHTRMHARI